MTSATLKLSNPSAQHRGYLPRGLTDMSKAKPYATS
jgi:hypothetical protein